MSDTSLRTETRDAASPAELARHLAGAPFIYGLAAPLAFSASAAVSEVIAATPRNDRAGAVRAPAGHRYIQPFSL